MFYFSGPIARTKGQEERDPVDSQSLTTRVVSYGFGNSWRFCGWIRRGGGALEEEEAQYVLERDEMSRVRPPSKAAMGMPLSRLRLSCNSKMSLPTPPDDTTCRSGRSSTKPVTPPYLSHPFL